MEKKLSFRNYFGYGILDLGNNIGFSCTSTFLTLYYTDVLGKNFDKDTAYIWGIIVTVIMVIARIWDGINDPMMGTIVQRTKFKNGKFRSWLLIGGIPLALVFASMFIPFENISLGGAIAYASITYILYGMLYTIVLVPYGSMATVMTRNENERSLLSITRSIGGGIGGIPAGMILPNIVYIAISTTSEDKELDKDKLFIASLIIAVIILISYIIGYFNTKETYPYKESENKIDFKSTIKSLIKSKPFVIISLVGMLLIASSMFINSMDMYLFNIYYGMSGMMMYVTIATYVPMILLIPFSGKIIKKFGKKEFIVPSLLIAAIASLVMVLWRIPNAWIFIAFVVLQGIGVGFITLEIWALAMDVIDYQEYKTGKREEAPTYAVFTFMRKIGQALAACVPLILSIIGYQSSLGYNGQSASTVDGIYTFSTLIPFILFTLMFVLMIFYPLNKKKYQEMKDGLALIRGE